MGCPGAYDRPAVYLQRKTWEYSFTLFANTRARRHRLAQAMSHKLLEAGSIQYRNITRCLVCSYIFSQTLVIEHC